MTAGANESLRFCFGSITHDMGKQKMLPSYPASLPASPPPAHFRILLALHFRCFFGATPRWHYKFRAQLCTVFEVQLIRNAWSVAPACRPNVYITAARVYACVRVWLCKYLFWNSSSFACDWNWNWALASQQDLKCDFQGNSLTAHVSISISLTQSLRHSILCRQCRSESCHFRILFVYIHQYEISSRASIHPTTYWSRVLVAANGSYRSWIDLAGYLTRCTLFLDALYSPM